MGGCLLNRQFGFGIFILWSFEKKKFVVTTYTVYNKEGFGDAFFGS